MVKAKLKNTARKALNKSKVVVHKNMFARNTAYRIRNILFSNVKPVIYNHAKYAPTLFEYLTQREEEKSIEYRPLISIVMPTYNTPADYLKECIESVLVQSYSNWELCIADDASPDKSVVEIIKFYQKQDKRIKLVNRANNGHISAATNSAIEISGGEFIALLDHDDILWPNALYEVVMVLNQAPKTDFIYSDEDKIDEDNIHTYPFFKPDWSPEFLESCNYITHFSVLRRSLVKQVGGLRVGYEGAQDWDLFLRASEQTDNIIHIPKLLYSWRIHDASTAKNTDSKPYVYQAQKKLLEDHISRTGKSGLVKQGVITQHSSIEYSLDNEPLVSIIVAGNVKDLNTSVPFLFKNASTYQKLELILVTNEKNNSKHAFKDHKKDSRITYVSSGSSFNDAKLFNLGAKASKGEYIVFIEGSLKIDTIKLIELMLADAQIDGVGAVGGKVVNKTKVQFLRAGCATGIFSIYAPLLEGMAVTDKHYMRGLYGQSRRNVSILDGYFMVKKSLYDKVGGFNSDLNTLFYADFCLSLIKMGYRNIYNPYVQAADLHNVQAVNFSNLQESSHEIIEFKRLWQAYIDYDPYFNPNFSRKDAQMDFLYG